MATTPDGTCNPKQPGPRLVFLAEDLNYLCLGWGKKKTQGPQKLAIHLVA